MSVKIADLVHKFITPDMVSTVSRVLGEEPGAVTRGMSAAVTSLLHGIEDCSHDDQAMAEIAGMANMVARDQSGLLDIKALMTSGAMPSPASLAGSKLLGMTFGVEQSSLTDLVAHVSGLRTTSAASLLALAAPNVLTAVGARLGGGVVDGPSLARLVRQNGDEFTGVFSLTGVGDLAGHATGGSRASGSGAPAVLRTGAGRASALDADSTTVTRGWDAMHAGPQPRSASTGLFTVLSILAVPALILGGLYWLKINAVPGAPQVMVTEAPAVAPSPTPAPAPATAPQPAAAPVPPAGMARIALADGSEIEAAAEGVETKIIGFVTNPNAEIDKGLWFDFDRLNFETGSTALTQESKAQIANIAAILKAYPSVKLKIGGYTDNVGSRVSNLVLSDKRARAVRDAIIAHGIDKDRVDAEGYGDKHPIADNATPEGRAKNRRTAVSVRAK